jgi:polyhydroxyalkanoate synthesis regulator phasin
MVATKEAEVSKGGASVRGFQADVERLVNRVRQGWTDVTERPGGTLSDVVKQARRFRADLQKRAESVVRRVEQRASRVVNGIEDGIAVRLSPVSKRLNVASRRDLEALCDRVSELEKRVDLLTKSAKAA